MCILYSIQINKNNNNVDNISKNKEFKEFIKH